MCCEGTETPKDRRSTVYKELLSTVHTLHCDLDLQGKQVKRKRKRQAVDGEEDLTIGEK